MNIKDIKEGSWVETTGGVGKVIKVTGSVVRVEVPGKRPVNFAPGDVKQEVSEPTPVTPTEAK